MHLIFLMILGMSLLSMYNRHINFVCIVRQVGQLSQANCAAACISFGKNISEKSVHLTLPYPTALTTTDDRLTILRHVCS